MHSRVKSMCTYHREIDIGGVEFHVDLLVNQSLAVFVVVLPDLGHGHPDSDWAPVFGRGEERILRRGWGTRGRPRTLSGVAKSKTIWGVAEWQQGSLWVTGLDLTEAALTGAPFSYQPADLHNYTPDATHYEIYPYQETVYQPPGAIYIRLLTTLSKVTNPQTKNIILVAISSLLFRSHPLSSHDILKGFKSCHMDEYKGRIIQTKHLHMHTLADQYSTTCVEATRR